MLKSLIALGGAAVMLFAVPQGASALPGQASGIKNSEAANIVKVHRRGWRHRHYRHRHWRHRHWRHRPWGYRYRYYRRPHFGIYF
jgi:hypothetical protein